MNAMTAIKPPTRRTTLSLGKTKRQAEQPAPAVAAPPTVVVVPSAPGLFALGRLMRAAENVRHVRIEEGCEELADDIQAHGLLQSLIGYLDGDKVEIVGGGRRLRALRIVKARGWIDDTFPVPVLIRDIDEAVELSLAENLQQRTMSPVDEFLAFAKLMEIGSTSPRDLAKRFGFSERVVKQRLRLAQLASPVLEALAERQITLDAAMAYATSQDTALQVEVFEVQSKRGRTAHDPAGVRHSLRIKGVDTADRLFRLVGADRYEAEGGTYEDDLFTDPAKERVLAKPFLLETLAHEIVDFRAARLVDALTDRLIGADEWSPKIAGFVKVPDLRAHDWGTAQKMHPPLGFVLVERAESDRLWRTIRNNGLAAHVVVGVDERGEVVAVPRYAFVPIGQKAAVERPALAGFAGYAARGSDAGPPDTAVDTAMTASDAGTRGAIAEREREIIRWSRRLAVPSVAGTPLEGRVFWPDHDQAVRQTVAGRDGFTIGMLVFVADDEIAAHRPIAAAEVDRRMAARTTTRADA